MVRPGRSLVALLALLAWAAGGPPSLGAQPARERPQAGAIEGGLADRIYVRLAERAWAGADFDVRVRQGVVTLSGTVPDERAKQRILGVVHRTRGVSEVRDRLRIDPAAGQPRAGAPVPDAELARRVAQQVAAALGARAGEDWWFSGWRVEGPYRNWTMVVDAADGAVTLDGEVPYDSIVRRAVQAALRVPGVLSVRSEVELEAAVYGPPAYYWWHPYDLTPGDDADR
jgi:osmotically-inducible protein OsmY